MKKSIFYILALLLAFSCTVSCKVIEEPEMDAVTDPLTYWNTYIMKDPPKPFTYFSCTWNHPLHSSLSAPTSSDPEVIAEVLRRLRTLNVTEAQKTELESSERTEQFGTMAMRFDWGGFGAGDSRFWSVRHGLESGGVFGGLVLRRNRGAVPVSGRAGQL